ncbi:uncharacterized protein LOC125072119 [Vanessa atalanta]|uniref:uncharacterized protein LOC125072119 n=1 Tax=Vanessa atalanta TaxID=42275 RepID=UPI001FCD71A6|nr:uncharacterized protein LOC125072119 [Vanessa atalanta]
MESISYHPILKLTQDDVTHVRKLYNLDVKKINENLDAIEEWIKKQDHLVESLPYMIKEKIGNRIFIHNSYEELYEEIPKEILPQEYGGDLQSCSKLSDELKNYLKSDEAREVIEHSSKIVSNETRRNCIRFNEEYLGMAGSFKQLNVD